MSDGVDPAAVEQWKSQLLEHLRKRPRDNISLGNLRKDVALALAVQQLVKENAPRIILTDFGDSMTLSWRISLDGLPQETIMQMKQEQLIIDAEMLNMLGGIPDAPGRPQTPAVKEGE